MRRNSPRPFLQWWQTTWRLHIESMAKRTVLYMGRDSCYYTGVGIFSRRCSRDGGVQKTSQVRRAARVIMILSVSADSSVNSGPNQRVGCAVLKQSGPQNRFNMCWRLGRTIPFSVTLDCFAAIQCNVTASVVCEWWRSELLAIQLFLNLHSF